MRGGADAQKHYKVMAEDITYSKMKSDELNE